MQGLATLWWRRDGCVINQIHAAPFQSRSGPAPQIPFKEGFPYAGPEPSSVSCAGMADQKTMQRSNRSTEDRMTPKVSLRKALEDPDLLGSALAGPTWHAWRSLLLAAMGEPLTKDELKTFTKFTGRTNPPSQRIDELWCCIGRRGGKSRAMAVLAVYLAGLCDYAKLARGETGIVLLIAPDKKQAKVLLDYAEGTLESTPLMKQLILSRTAEELTLTTGITLAVRGGNFRRVRGMTCVAVLADECAFWMSDESANPDVEISECGASCSRHDTRTADCH